MNWLIILITFIPVIAEIFFDKWRWSKGLDDKPISTYLRGILFIIIAVILGFIYKDTPFWHTCIAGLALVVTTHGVFFDNFLNFARNPRKPFFYHPAKKKGGIFNMIFYHIASFWNMLANRVHWTTEVFVKFIWYYSVWTSFFHWEWVAYGNTPIKLLDYFNF
jgi:hypothetical protein